MRIESLLEAIQTPKMETYQKKRICNCQYGEIILIKPKNKLDLRENCSLSCICAEIINEKSITYRFVNI